ncbi:MAG: glutathione peroxidase [Pikeienuella sp.]
MLRKLGFAAGLAIAGAASAEAPDFTFASIDGGEIALSDFRGGPVLVVNTASRCGFTDQYQGMQALYDAYREHGLIVLAVPSNAFYQELSSNAAVKEFCEVTYGLSIPMTEVTEVTGDNAHALYQWLREEHGFEPGWNFNKVLLDADGGYIESWGARTDPMSDEITGAVEAALTH